MEWWMVRVPTVSPRIPRVSAPRVCDGCDSVPLTTWLDANRNKLGCSGLSFTLQYHHFIGHGRVMGFLAAAEVFLQVPSHQPELSKKDCLTAVIVFA